MKFLGSLKNILTLNFFLITVVPILIVGVVVLGILKQHLTDDIGEKNTLLVETLGREVELSLEKSEATLRQLADIIDQGNAISKENINLHLNSIIKHHDELEMVRLLDVKGTVTHIAPFSRNYIGINMSYQPFVQDSMVSLESQWSSIFRSSLTREPTIALCIPLKNGILIGYLNLKSLEAIVNKTKIGTLGYAFIVDSEGTFIAHPNQAYVAEQINLKNVPEITRQPSGNKKAITFKILGEEVFSTTTRVPLVNWGITVIQPVNEAFLSYNKIRNIIVAGILVTITLVVCLVMIIPKKILHPLFQLTQYSKRVAAGDVSVFNYQKSYQEVNDLATNFGIMIGSLKERENQLWSSKEKAQKYLDIAKVILLALDSDKKVSLINRKGCEVLGYKEDEIVGHDWMDNFLPERDRKQTGLLFDKLMSGTMNSSEGVENNILTKDGQERTLLWHNSIIMNDAGEITGTLSSGEDITERKKAETDLRESEERYQLATRASDNGIWDWWTHSDEVFLSDQWKAQLGYRPDELENLLSTWENLLHPECKPRIINRIQEFLSSPSGYFLEEFRLQHKDGTYRWIANKAAAVLDGDKVIRMFGSHTDITERKETEDANKILEKQIAQSKKLKSLGVMAGGIAHNFNNNLAIILGNIELLESELQSNSYALSCIKDSTFAITRSKDLVDQILTFSKRGSIDSPPNFFVPVFKETISLLHSSLPGSVEISVGIDPQVENKIVYINPSQLQEVIINLSNNAVHAMKEVGELLISISLQVLSQHNIPIEYPDLKSGEFIELKVTDTGCGIPKQDLDKIFDPFFTTRLIHESTGLGLSMVQGIVRQSKGFIKVDSQLGVGSSFTLYFQTTTELPVVENDSLSEVTGMNESILFVDDEPSLARLGKRLLEKHGYQVTSLTNPEEALDIIKEDPNRFKLVITDQLMPQMKGDDLLASILGINPDVKTIICSGNVDKVGPETVEKVGVEFILKKPVNHEKLLNSIKILFDR